MITSPRSLSRFLLSSPASALRLGRTTAVMELRLPAGFHALSRDEQREALERAAGDAVEGALARIPG